MNKVNIVINEEKCRGCRRCEVACSWTEDGYSNPRLAGIKVMRLEDKGKDFPTITQQCLEKFCGKLHPWQPRDSEVPRCVATCLFGALMMKEGDFDD